MTSGVETSFGRPAYLWLRSMVCLCSVVVAGCASPVNDVNKATDSSEAKWLFVVRADSGTFVVRDGEQRLSLKGVDHILYFSDRPQRQVMTAPPDTFVHLWDKTKWINPDDADFTTVPPNAAFVRLETVHNRSDPDAVIELLDARVDADGGLSFGWRYVNPEKAAASLTGTFAQVALFIDRRAPPPDPCSTCPSSFGC